MADSTSSARTLGIDLLLSLYRAARLGNYHSMENQAFQKAAGHLCSVVNQLLHLDPTGARILFLERSILVGNRYLKAQRAVYESAAELRIMLDAAGGNQISFVSPLSVTDVTALVRALDAGATGFDKASQLPEAVEIRLVDLSAFESETAALSPDDRTIRQFASAIVVVRHLYESLKDGEYVLLQQLKRISQSVLVLAEDSTIQQLGIRTGRNLSHDEATRAVCRAVVSVSVLRQLTEDKAILSLGAMSALLFGAGRARAAGLGKPSPSGAVRAIPRLSREAQERLAASTAVVLIALGRLHDKSLQRLVVAYEAQKVLRADNPIRPYGDDRRVVTVALIVATVAEFIDLLRFEVRTQVQRSPEEAISLLRATAKGKLENGILDLLAGVLKVFPMGTGVELVTGYKGVVLGPSDGEDTLAQRVRVITDPGGQAVVPFDVDLGSEDGESLGWIYRAVRPEDDPALNEARERVVRESAEYLAVSGTFPAVQSPPAVAPPRSETPPPPSPPEPVPFDSTPSNSDRWVRQPSDAEIESLFLGKVEEWGRDPTQSLTPTDTDQLLKKFLDKFEALPTKQVTRERLGTLLHNYLEGRSKEGDEPQLRRDPRFQTLAETLERVPALVEDTPASEPAFNQGDEEPGGSTKRVKQDRVNALLDGYLGTPPAEMPHLIPSVSPQETETPNSGLESVSAHPGGSPAMSETEDRELPPPSVADLGEGWDLDKLLANSFDSATAQPDAFAFEGASLRPRQDEQPSTAAPPVLADEEPPGELDEPTDLLSRPKVSRLLEPFQPGELEESSED